MHCNLGILRTLSAAPVGLSHKKWTTKLWTTAATFADISLDTVVQGQLMAAYGEVSRVGAWPGIISEHRTEGGLGKTMASVWRDEFVRLRDGDQFFYRRQSRIPRIVIRRLKKCVRDILRR